MSAKGHNLAFIYFFFFLHLLQNLPIIFFDLHKKIQKNPETPLFFIINSNQESFNVKKN